MVSFNVQIEFYLRNALMCFMRFKPKFHYRIHKSQTLECMYWKRCESVLVMKVYVGAEVYLYSFFTSALDGGEWQASRPGCFTGGERAKKLSGSKSRPDV